MDIFIKTNRKTIQLPVLPSSFFIKEAVNNTEVNINSIGTVNLLGKRGLKSIQFSSFFPAQQYNFLKCAAAAPYTYCAELIKAMEENDICVLTITGTNISLTSTIESFEYGEEDRCGDVSYTISFKEYRSVSTARVQKKVVKKTYKVKKGDTWYSIARKFTGLSANAAKIAKLNGKKITQKPKAKKKVKINVEN